MNTLTEKQHENLIQKIYENLMQVSYMDENGEFFDRGMGEMGETRDEAEMIISQWIQENNISII